MTGSSRSKPVVDWARRLGCEVVLTRRGHYKVKLDGRLIAVMASTPSDRRSMKNARAQIRRGIKKMRSKENA